MQILPHAHSFLHQNGSTGCILMHGFSCSPEEILPLDAFLTRRGYTTLGLRFAGHGTTPEDLNGVRWTDWLANIEDAFHLLQGSCEKVVLIGQSMGGILSLTAASYLGVDAVIAISTPFWQPAAAERILNRLLGWIKPTIRKRNVQPHPEWGLRREANYPAYCQFPAAITRQTSLLMTGMKANLSRVRAPVLIIQSRQDNLIPPNSLESIQAGLTAASRVVPIWVEGPGHGITLDAQAEQAFLPIETFLATL
ncbi:MAG TPA: alpha/beta fold hydrolase [Anaerolineaceae bacterium]|nr:alpha/beta fold hydrolase [Anaerolineaceae bacterium]